MAAAWEITAVRQQSLLLATICPPDHHVSLNWMKRASRLQFPPAYNADRDWLLPEGLPYDEARNAAAKAALDGGYNWLAFLDSDTVPTRPDAFLQLIQVGLPFVAGVYRQRYPPFRIAAFNEAIDKDGSPGLADLPPFRWGELVPCAYIPTGLTLIRCDLLRAVQQKYGNPFEWTMRPFTSPKGRSEDYDYSWKVRQLGIQPFLVTYVTARHEVQGSVGPEDAAIEYGNRF